jgi:hypothetical protein
MSLRAQHPLDCTRTSFCPRRQVEPTQLSPELFPELEPEYDWRWVSLSVLVGLDQILVTFWQLLPCPLEGALSDERTGLSPDIVPTPRRGIQAKHSTNHLRELIRNIKILKTPHVRGLAPGRWIMSRNIISVDLIYKIMLFFTSGKLFLHFRSVPRKN